MEKLLVQPVCRICRACCSVHHCKRLFTTAGIRERWASRLSDLLLVPATRGDGLPAQICHRCSIKIKSIEESLRNLEEMRQSAKSMIECFCRPNAEANSVKRAKDTSGMDVSPQTARSLPAAKRRPRLQPRQLQFNPNEVPCT